MRTLVELENETIIRKIPLQKDEYLLGRGKDRDIVFDRTKVSRQHAKITQVNGEHFLIDTVSTNFTFVNGMRIKKHKLIPGDTIQLSSEVTLLYLNEETPDAQVTSLVEHKNQVAKADFLYYQEAIQHLLPLMNLKALLELAIISATSLVAAERGFIALLDAKGDLSPEDCFYYGTVNAYGLSSFSQSVAEEALSKRKDICILYEEDTEQDLSASIMDLSLQAIMCAPLLSENEVLGLLYVDTSFSDHAAIGQKAFSATHQLFFFALARQIAMLIRNTQNWEKLKHDNQQPKTPKEKKT